MCSLGTAVGSQSGGMEPEMDLDGESDDLPSGGRRNWYGKKDENRVISCV